MTSIDCPGCGMQSAFILLLKGDIVSSFLTHPALIPLILSIIIYAANYFSPKAHLDRLFSYSIILTCVLLALNYGIKCYRLDLF